MPKRYASVRQLRTLRITWPTLPDYEASIPEATKEALSDRLFLLAGLLYRRLPGSWSMETLERMLLEYCELRRPNYLVGTFEKVDIDLADIRTLNSELSSGAKGFLSWIVGAWRVAS